MTSLELSRKTSNENTRKRSTNSKSQRNTSRTKKEDFFKDQDQDLRLQTDNLNPKVNIALWTELNMHIDISKIVDDDDKHRTHGGFGPYVYTLI